MTKQKDGDEIVESAVPAENSVTVTQEFFFPPQDGRDAFVCQAENRTDAEAQYADADKK